MAYLTFAGDIPAGEYGGGQMRIWDTGRYETLEWTDSKVTVRIEGHRHRGEWHLFRPSADRPKEWMVVRSSRDPVDLVADPPRLQPCLATGGGSPFDDDGWLFEVKWDGVRALATTTRPGAGVRGDNDGRTVLHSRNGNDISEAYPEIASLWERVLAFNAVLDGEIVALGPDGRPSFSLLQQRMHLRGAERVARARRTSPVTYMVFDVLAVDGQQVTGLPLTDRLSLLDDLLVPGDRVLRSEPVAGAGTALFQAARTQGLEGIMAKRASSTYLPGRRSPDWLKIKVRRTAEVVVGGWLESSTGDAGLGSLLVGAHDDDGELRYLGRVGTGFDAATRTALRDRLGPDAPDPFDGVAATPAEAVHWVAPRLVVEVEYGELTGEGRLRAPSFRTVRDEVDPSSVRHADVG